MLTNTCTCQLKRSHRDVLYVYSQRTLCDFDCVSCLWSESASCGRLENCGSQATTSVAVFSAREGRKKEKKKKKK